MFRLTVTLLFITSILPGRLCEATHSVYPDPIHDPAAVYLSDYLGSPSKEKTDVTTALQEAINEAESNGVFGIVIVPSGNYVLSDTIYIWKGIRVIGCGPTRPVFTLAPGTPGFSGPDPKYLFHFTSYRPEPGEPVRDANPGTFYSALTNVDLVIEGGNPGAVGVRSHFAQHCFLSHIRFDIGQGLAGVQKVGNIIHDCEFIGGQYGIMTTKPSPSWPFALMDSRFEGQREAAILTEEAGLSILRCFFSDTAHAVYVRDGRSEELVMENCRAERISESLIRIAEPHNARTQVNLERIDCIDVSQVAKFTQSVHPIPGREGQYRISDFSHGLHIPAPGVAPEMDTRVHLESVAGDLLALEKPFREVPPNTEWVNVVSLGAIGNAEFDNTSLLQDAIDRYDTLYFPTGRYRVSDSLKLRPQSVLVGLSPITTQILIHDESPGFHPAGTPRAVIESASGGAAIIQAIGIDPGAINHRAAALKWRSGPHSLVRDVRFIGGHGTYDTEGNYLPIYNNNRSADSDPRRRWDKMPASLWVTDNGGGHFINLWTPSPFAHAGLLVENTRTPGTVIQMSSEHHSRNEVMVRNAANWSFYALQFEEENWEGRHALPLLIENSHDLRFHNTYLYRVSRTFTPYPNGIVSRNSHSLMFKGIHAYSPTKFTFDNTLRVHGYPAPVRSREIARLEIPEELPFAACTSGLEQLASGFNHIDSPEVGPDGHLYFVDAFHQKIYRWNVVREQVELLLDAPIEPEQIVHDGQDGLMIITRTGKVYHWTIGRGYAGLQALEPTETPEDPAVEEYVIPLTRWRDGHDFPSVTQMEKPYFYRYGTIGIPAESNLVNAGIRTTYFRTIDLIRAFDLMKVKPGQEVWISDEFSQKTWKYIIDEQGNPGDPQLFAEEGEAGVAVDGSGRVYIAAGQVLVFDPTGRHIDTIRTPERPTGLLVVREGNREVLYIPARSSLYRIAIPSPI